MIINSVRMLSTWLADGSNGVNSLLSGLSKDVGDATPSNVTVQNQFDDAAVARRTLPDDATLPLLWIFSPTDNELEGFEATARQSAGDLKIAMALFVTDADSEVGQVAAHLTWRALRQSLNNLFTGNEASRTLNGVQLKNLQEATMIEGVRFENTQQSLVYLVSFRVEDIEP